MTKTGRRIVALGTAAVLLAGCAGPSESDRIIENEIQGETGDFDREGQIDGFKNRSDIYE